MQATDIAKAMVYLHSTRYWEEEKQEWQKCVIHRDLKVRQCERQRTN